MLRRLYDQMITLAASPRAALWLAVVAFAEASFFPVPPDLMLIPMALGQKLAAETGRAFTQSAAGDYVAGTYSRRFALSSGRVAMIEVMSGDGGMGFQLVPWTPSIEKQLGRHVSGVARGDGGVDWGFGRKRGLGL